MTVAHHWSPHQAGPAAAAAAAPIATASNVYFVDNYDSFTWNVYQYLILEGATVTVVRNDEISLDELISKKPSQLIISPGPGHPLADSGISRDAIRHFSGKIPIWGVCMGHQCIIAAFGGIVESAGEFLHGKTSPLSHDSKGIYQGLAQGISITRYHSLAGNRSTMPACLEISSWVDRPDGSAGVIQGVRHKEYTIEGVQFHPESILTDGGRAMVRNFLRVQGGTWAENERLQKAAAAPGSTPAVPVAPAVPAAPAVSTAPTAADKKNILQRIYAARRAAVEIQKTIPSQRPADLQAGYDLGAAPAQIDFISRLRRSPFDVSLMAEIKRASPSKGVFDLDMDAPTQARRYALAGASVISVLTEPEWFKGSIDDLRAVRQVLGGMANRPAILRKEFIFDEYQILEARLAGADTVLLIVKMLPPDLLARLCAYSRSLGMEPLVEVQTADEMSTAIRLGARVVGVNNRNLESFEVDLGTTGRLRGMVSADTVICALSGISTHEDVLMCKKDGINAILVGEAIMRAPDAGQFIRQLCAGSGAAAAPAPAEPDREQVATARLLVKICGTRSAEAAAAAAREGADIVGMILSPQSGRCVSADVALAISAEIGRSTRVSSAPRIPDTVATDFFGTAAARLPSRRPLLAGVFQNQALSEVLEKQKAYGLDIVQLHGDEPAEWAALIPVPVFRAFKPTQAGIGVRGYHTLPVLDGGGGSGVKLDAAAVRSVLERDPGLSIILAGGLNPANVAEAVGSVGPALASRIVGVDVSSGVEVDGEQSLERIGEFIRAARAIQ